MNGDTRVFLSIAPTSRTCIHAEGMRLLARKPGQLVAKHVPFWQCHPQRFARGTAAKGQMKTKEQKATLLSGGRLPCECRVLLQHASEIRDLKPRSCIDRKTSSGPSSVKPESKAASDSFA